MRAALLLTLALGGLMLGIWWLLPRGDAWWQPDGPPPAVGDAALLPPARTNLIDLRSSRGRDLFMPEFGETVMGGESVRYQRMLLWARALGPEGEGRFEVLDTRVVFLPRPATVAELAALPEIPLATPPEEVGERIERLLADGASGLRAARAVFTGGRDLARAARGDLEDGFTAQFADRKDPTARIQVSGRRAELGIENGRITTVRSSEEVVVHGPQGRFRGIGFTADLVQGELSIYRAIEGELRDPALVGRAGEPIRVQAEGPLVFVPAAPPAEAGRLATAGTLRIRGSVRMVQGTTEVRGERFDAEFAEAVPRLVRVRVAGAAEIILALGSIAGEDVVYEAHTAPGGRLIVRGSPLRATIRNGQGWLPGLSSDGDLEIESIGTAVLDGVDVAVAGTRRLEIGEAVVLRGEGVEGAARRVQVFLRRMPRSPELTGPRDLVEVPVRVEVQGPLRGEGPSGSFSGAYLVYNRHFEEDGTPRLDTIDLNGEAKVVHRLMAAPSAGPPPDRLDLLARFDGSGRLEASAEEGLHLAYDPLRQRPTVLRGKSRVLIERFGTAEGGEPAGRFRSQSCELVLVEDWAPTERGTFRMRRSIRSFTGTGEVSAEIPGLLAATGDHLRFDGEALRGELRCDEGRLATVDFATEDGRRHAVRCATVEIEEGGLEAVLRGGVVGSLWLAPVQLFGKDASGAGAAILTELAGEEARLQISDPARGQAGRRRITHVTARGAARIVQPGRLSASGSDATFDILERSLLLAGTPATIELSESVDGATWSSRLESQRVVLLPGQALVRGPFQATLPVMVDSLALDLGRPRQGASGPTGPSPLTILAAGDLAAAVEAWTVGGPATLRLGDPGIDGFEVQGGRLHLFPEPPRPGEEGSLRADFARAVVEDSVHYRTAEVSGRGDVMTFDRARRQIELWSREDAATLSLPRIGVMDYRRPAFRVNLADPERPFFDSIDRPKGNPLR